MHIDLFNHLELLPIEVKIAIEKFNEVSEIDGTNYKDCEELLRILAPLGYAFEYGLDTEPYDLVKIN